MKTFATLVVLLAVLGCPVLATAGELEDSYTKGLQSYNAGDPMSALDSWCKILESKPGSDATQSKAIAALVDLVRQLSTEVDQLKSKLKDRLPAAQPPKTTTTVPTDGKLELRRLNIVNSAGAPVITLDGDDIISGTAETSGPNIFIRNPNATGGGLLLVGGGKITEPGIMITSPGKASLTLTVTHGSGTVYAKDNEGNSSMLRGLGLSE